jgi:hypothetical protein
MKYLKYIIYILICLIILSFFIILFFTSRQENQENNDKSIDRMVKIKRALIASFGQYWAVNLITYLILICIIFTLLFLYTSVDKLNITISDHNGRMIYWVGITLSLIFSVLIIGSACISYINYEATSNYYVPNTIESNNNNLSIQNRIIVVKIVVSIILIISVILSVFLYIKKRKKV